MSTQAEPKYLRATVATGNPTVERDGGRFGFGVIRNVSVITEGEALGHDLWIDSEFNRSVMAAINLSETGIKTRLTHPGLSSDGVGSKLGKIDSARVIGDQVVVDHHFTEASTKTPDGNLSDYVMTLAEETPEDFGVSIVFAHDADAESAFIAANMQGEAKAQRFVSPDENNLNNYTHARLSQLRAADVVDDPAANPDGLFKRGQEAAIEGEQLIEYALGLSDAKPQTSMFNVDGDRAKQFLARFLSRHNLKIEKEGDPVSDAQHEEAVVEVAEEELPTRADFSAELSRYITAFGAENGAEWYTQELSFSDAQALHIETLGNEIKLLNAKIGELEETLSAIDMGEDDGAEFNPGTVKKSGKFNIKIAGKKYDDN